MFNATLDAEHDAVQPGASLPVTAGKTTPELPQVPQLDAAETVVQQGIRPPEVFSTMVQQTGTLLRCHWHDESAMEAPGIALRGHQAAARQPVARDEALETSTASSAPSDASWPLSCPAGSFMAGTSVPAMINLLDAGGAVSPDGPQRQRRRRASALTR